ncbi:MAG: hypothetical protein K8W52_33740 [Deltaproteobacteria bacterium]|nr:hypothetical protein [Deltaproteobacteria bacterium]
MDHALRRRRIGIVACCAAIVTTAGCSGSKSQATCRSDAHELATLLTAINRPSYQIDPDVHLVARPSLALPAVRPALVVEVRASGVSLDGDPVVDRDSLPARLTARAGELSRYGIQAPRVRLAIDATARWSEIVQVADAAAAAGIPEIELMFAVPPVAVTPPPRTAVDDELDRATKDADASDKATRFAQLVARVAEPCPALTRVFGALATPGEDKATALIAGIEPALIECQCAADVSALRSLLFRLLDDRHPAAPLSVTIAATGRTVTLPAATPWSEASAQLTLDEPVHLRIAP